MKKYSDGDEVTCLRRLFSARMGIDYSLLVLALIATSFPNLAYANLGKRVTKFANWQIFRSESSMSDRVTCTGILGRNSNVQLNKSQLFLHVSGVPEGYRFRVDDQKASGMIVDAGILQNMGLIRISGERFAKISTGKPHESPHLNRRAPRPDSR